MTLKTKGKFWTIILCVSFLLAALPATAAPAVTTLDALVVANKDIERESFSQAFRIYEELHPEIKINESFIDAGNFETKVVNMTAGGVQPDVMWLWGINFRNMAPKGYLLPLDKYLDGQFLTDYFPNAIETSRYKGITYALPGLLGTMAILTNLDMFANAGVQPVDYSDNWDTFLAKCKKLTQKDSNGTTKQYGFTWYAYTVRDWTTWLWRNDGDLLNDQLTALTLDTPNSVEALQYLSDLTNVHGVTPPGSVLWGSPWTGFSGTQTVAMYPSGSWSMGTLETAKFDIDVSPYPARKNRTVTMDTFFMAVHANAKHPDEAAALAKWMTHSTEGQGQLYATKFGIPAIRKEAVRFFMQNDSPHNLGVFLDALNVDQARALPYVENWADIEKALREEFLHVWRGEKAAQSAVDEITPLINAMLK